MSAADALKRRKHRGGHSGRMGGGGRVQHQSTPSKNILEAEQKTKTKGEMNAAFKKTAQS